MHLTEEEIQRLVDRQLPEDSRRTLEQHVGQCPECQVRLEIARRETAEILARLRMVDHPVPSVTATRVIRRAGRTRPTYVRWAAAMLLTFGLAGVAYAAPGSPLPGWIRTLAVWVGATSVPVADPVAALPAPVPPSAGIAVYPGERLAILFQFGAHRGSVHISLTQGQEVVVRAASGAAGFTAGAGQITVEGRTDTTTFEVQIPRSAPRVEVLLRGRRIFLKSGGSITTAATAEADGAYLLPLDP